MTGSAASPSPRTQRRELRVWTAAAESRKRGAQTLPPAQASCRRDSALPSSPSLTTFPLLLLLLRRTRSHQPHWST
ncbi:hypothetical protein E2C01_059430 [Portunus trituberculatus]|uniref:Uncharacterized protein n=1 Tax=Portunus trituberculatus TaxID=210409 RepID=A0A5B7H7J0_PORTR|nr:hypothetical protein [Portunus trituberculatus]